MSYDVSSVEVKVLDARMKAVDVIKTRKELGDWIPGNCFLHDMKDLALDAILSGESEKLIPLPNFRWSSTGSGHAFHEHMLQTVAPKIMGLVEAILTWDGGDSVTGLLIEDGRGVECDVERTVVRPQGW